MNSITGLLLKWWSEVSSTTNIFIAENEPSSIYNKTKHLTNELVNVSTQLTYQNTVLKPQLKHD